MLAPSKRARLVASVLKGYLKSYTFSNTTVIILEQKESRKAGWMDGWMLEDVFEEKRKKM